MTTGPAKGVPATPGHPPVYRSLHQAKRAAWWRATKASTQPTTPDWCDDCDGWHVTTTTAATTAGS